MGQTDLGETGVWPGEGQGNESARTCLSAVAQGVVSGGSSGVTEGGVPVHVWAASVRGGGAGSWAWEEGPSQCGACGGRADVCEQGELAGAGLSYSFHRICSNRDKGRAFYRLT